MTSPTTTSTSSTHGASRSRDGGAGHRPDRPARGQRAPGRADRRRTRWPRSPGPGRGRVATSRPRLLRDRQSPKPGSGPRGTATSTTSAAWSVPSMLDALQRRWPRCRRRARTWSIVISSGIRRRWAGIRRQEPGPDLLGGVAEPRRRTSRNDGGRSVALKSPATIPARRRSPSHASSRSRSARPLRRCRRGTATWGGRRRRTPAGRRSRSCAATGGWLKPSGGASGRSSGCGSTGRCPWRRPPGVGTEWRQHVVEAGLGQAVTDGGCQLLEGEQVDVEPAHQRRRCRWRRRHRSGG